MKTIPDSSRWRQRAGLLKAGARSIGLRTGLLPYRPGVWTAEAWDRGYTTTQLDYFEGLEELPRYSIIAGYVAFFGGRPRILDVGCGPGYLRTRLDGLDFASYVGVDPTPAAIERAALLADERTRFVLADPVDADLGTFDVVVLNEVLSIVPRPALLVERMGKLVQPGGRILTSIWRHPGDQQLWRILDERFRRVDSVTVRNHNNPIGVNGWHVACHVP